MPQTPAAPAASPVPFRFPLDADVGDVAVGPGGHRYRLDYDDRWWPYGDGHPDRTPLPHVSPDDPERIAAELAASHAKRSRIEAEEAAARARAIAAAQSRCRKAEARDFLAAQDIRPDPDDMGASIYEGEHAAVIAETPPGQRIDGWTAERRVLFLERLGECGSIQAAARAAGVSRQSVYKLMPRAPAFAAAVAEALKSSCAILADTLFDRAVHGHQVPVVYQGEVVATRTVHHDMLGLYLLRVRDPLNFAPVDELDRWLTRRGLEEAPTGVRSVSTSSTSPSLPPSPPAQAGAQ